jgi:hypothetical protein
MLLIGVFVYISFIFVSKLLAVSCIYAKLFFILVFLNSNKELSAIGFC